MKKVFTFLVALVFILITSLSFARDMHKVELSTITPFSIGVEFPQTPENQAFEFNLYAGGDIGSMRYAVVVAKSMSDPNYQLLLLAVSFDEGKSIHIVAAMSGSMKNGQPKGLKVYRDEQFFAGKGFSGILVSAKDFPTPEDLEKVAPPKKTGV